MILIVLANRMVIFFIFNVKSIMHHDVRLALVLEGGYNIETLCDRFFLVINPLYKTIFEKTLTD